jgi:hypothetical protein
MYFVVIPCLQVCKTQAVPPSSEIKRFLRHYALIHEVCYNILQCQTEWSVAMATQQHVLWLTNWSTQIMHILNEKLTPNSRCRPKSTMKTFKKYIRYVCAIHQIPVCLLILFPQKYLNLTRTLSKQLIGRDIT